MNGLTLRLSCDKKIKPIKKEVQKEDIESLLIPDYGSKLVVFEKLLAAVSVEEQVQSIKEVFSSISIVDPDVQESVLVIEPLVHMFLSIKPKSPLSPPLLKFLSALSGKYLSTVENSVNNELSKRLQKCKYSVEEILESSLALQLCLDNKRSLCISLSQSLPLILSFLTTSLHESHQLLRTESIAIKKLTLINGIHNCVQVGISLCQQYAVSSAEELYPIVVEIFSDSDLPIDTRAAAGVLAAHLSSTFSPNHWIEVFQNILEQGNELGVLSFCSGLLNVLTPGELEVVVTVNGCSEHVLPFLFNTILDIEERNASESGIVLAATRCIVLLTKALSNTPSLLNRGIINSILSYLWSHMEHYMDAVRHLASAALSNVQSIAKAHPDLCIFEKILEDLEGMRVERRSKHAAISILVSHVSIENIISRSPGLIDALLKAALTNPSSNYAINSLQNLMEQDLKEQIDREKWFVLWVKPLLQAELSAPLELLLTAVLKIHPVIIQQIVSLGLNENDKNIAVILTCLKIGRKFNFLKGKDDNEKWKGLVDLQVLEKCMYHSEDDVRLSCFSLLIETSKSTEEFTPIELNIIKTFFSYNFNNQEPSVRQKSLATCKKFLTRLRDSQGALRRRQGHSKSGRSEASSENITTVLLSYSGALASLRLMCLQSLFPGSSPARRSFALGVLALFKQLGFWHDFDQNTAQILLSTLLDSYEENKAVAKSLLSSMPPSLLNFEDENHLNLYLKETLKLSSSIRPPDSISAAYYMSLLASYNQLQFGTNMIAQRSAFHCLTASMDCLSKELGVAKESLLQAACSGPLYGHLFVIRHLLHDIPLQEIGTCSEWQSLILKVITIAFECNSVVSHVVYNSSPEGHLPMDFTYSNLKKDSDPQVTSQMVLLCSWRTVKEVSLLLGELCERATISGDENEIGLLSQKQIIEIGKHLTTLLAETKHRGAFEQAYLGFSKLAARLWRCSCRELHELPTKWLDETLECICTNENLSATRRSAGIPFIVQALICSELDSGSCKTLQRAMVSLLHITQNGSTEGRVHALNILRTLYRGSSLGEAVGPYVAEGIATAIAGFNSNTWAERNSSTLLLSALMSRVFGVPRGKSEALSWRNRMTGRLFFQRYPSLYAVILKHLEASSANTMYPALYPVLLLLGRLYPSSLEGTDSNLQLMKYLPYVMQCCESSILKTRCLAATAASSLIPSSSHVDFLNHLMGKVREVEKENHRHGLLLMIHKLILQIHCLDEELKLEKLNTLINSWTQTLLDCLVSKKCSYISKDTCVQIIFQLFLTFGEKILQNDWESVKKVVENIVLLEMDEKCLQYGCEMFYFHCSILLLTMSFKEKRIHDFVQCITKLLRSSNYEVFGVALDLLGLALSDKGTFFTTNIHESLKLDLHDPSVVSELRKIIVDADEILSILLKKVCEGQSHHEDMVKILRVLQFFPASFKKFWKESPVQFLCRICNESPSSVSLYAIKCLDSFLIHQGEWKSLEGVELDAACKVVEEFSNAEQPDDCRAATASLIAANFETLLQAPSIASRLGMWRSAVELMMDETPDVRRTITSGLVGEIVCPKALELVLYRFVASSPLQESVVGLLSWAVAHPYLSHDDEESLFDKGPANTYHEELVLSRIACDLLSDLAKGKGISSLAIGEPYSQWLLEKTNISASSLNEFIDNCQCSMNDVDNSTNLLPHRPAESKYLLQRHKLENLLKIKCVT